jgi:hypothetical protein
LPRAYQIKTIRPSATVKVKHENRANGRAGQALAGIIKVKILFLNVGRRYLVKGPILL